MVRSRKLILKRKKKKLLKASTKASLKKSRNSNKRKYTRKYLQLRNYVLLRDRYECQLCGRTGVKLECHHVVKWSSSAVIRQNRFNLISLCKDCHRGIRNKEERYASIFKSRIMKNTARHKRENLTSEEIMRRRREQEALQGNADVYQSKNPEEIVKKKKEEDYLRVTWRGIKRRIFNEKSNKYHRYGGRGITMYPEWVTHFQLFKKYILENLGDRPPGHSIDRIDNDGNYEPGNLRWATADIQKQNNSQTKLDDVMAEVAFILFHKYKKKQKDIMSLFNMNNPTSIRNIVRGLAWNNVTKKYIKIVKDQITLDNMKAWEEKHAPKDNS
ncbi:MAG TPA: HNH endonuclease [Allocoleopsis sp.]|jgi:hypothetical protein